MSIKSVAVPSKKLQVEDHFKPRSFIYLPNEGLQGEDIPSHILWENVKVESIQVSFRSPLKFKDIFNVECWEIHDNDIVVKKVEMDGYVGLSFESSKASAIEVVVPVEYLIYLSNGDVIKEVKEIKLFKPKLEIKVLAKEITVNPKTGFIRGRIGIKNVGRGTIITQISTIEDSPIKLETPPEHREFAEKFVSDLLKEMYNLAKEFPQFQSILDEMLEWETKKFLELSAEERDKFAEYITKMANVLASDKKLLLGFVEAYAKALARNTEFIEAVRKVIKVYESLVSKDILLINPFDEIVLTGKKEEITLKISQTDRVFDIYEDITLPKIELTSSQEYRVPIYRLFEWG